MQITIELEPDTEAALRTQASAQGLDLAEYLRVLAEQAGASVSPDPRRLQDRVQAWEEFCEPEEELPALTDADLSREAMYSDHD